MALNATSNRWLDQYSRTLDPKGQAVLAEARRRRAAENQAQLLAGHNPLSGGYAWQEFEDFHKTRGIEAGMQGDRYKVGPISGGGDINQRAASGAGPTRQVNASAGSPNALRGTAPTATAVRAPAARAATGGSMFDFLTERPQYAGQHREITDLALRQLRAQVEGEELRTLGARAASVDPAQREGTQAWYDRQRGRAGLKREIASDDSWQQAQDANDQWWRFTDPQEQHSQGRALDRLRVQAEPARIAAQSRETVAGVNQGAQNERARMALLETIINALQRGEGANVGYNQPRADVLGGEFDVAREIGMGQARPGGASMPQAARPTAQQGPPDGGPARRTDNTGRAIVWDPTEQDWFYE